MKLIINIPDEAYELLKNKSELDNIAESIIANGTPVSIEGDLISRKALKEDINSLYEYDTSYNEEFDAGVQSIINFIDNAPTVFDCRSCKNNGNERECVDCHDYSNYAHYEERPQGEWEKIGEIGLAYKCNKCGEVDVLSTKFCPNCGADMRTEGDKNE